jgi:hypothetical protein
LPKQYWRSTATRPDRRSPLRPPKSLGARRRRLVSDRRPLSLAGGACIKCIDRDMRIVPFPSCRPGVEDGVEVFLPDAVEANGLVELRFGDRVLLEPKREVGAEFGLVALGVKRRASALRGCERDINAGILEDVIGSCKLFEPEARLSSGIAQLVVRWDNHQHLHDCLRCLRSSNEAPSGIVVEMLGRISLPRSLLLRQPRIIAKASDAVPSD